MHVITVDDDSLVVALDRGVDDSDGTVARSVDIDSVEDVGRSTMERRAQRVVTSVSSSVLKSPASTIVADGHVAVTASTPASISSRTAGWYCGLGGWYSAPTNVLCV